MKRPFHRSMGKIFLFEIVFLFTATLAARHLVGRAETSGTLHACDTGWGERLPYFQDHVAAYCADEAARQLIAAYFLSGLAVYVLTTLLAMTSAKIASHDGGPLVDERFIKRPLLVKLGCWVLFVGGVGLWLYGVDGARGDYQVFDSSTGEFVGALFVTSLCLPFMQFMATQIGRRGGTVRRAIDTDQREVLGTLLERAVKEQKR
ncbi:hypothetical protein [Sphingomicrobium aestuariivivum]|uniref:hypothetical protein n=1 Tax=Sphingomicrobium aestuariivivum TaxID=1582356 RepID=UPI001FD69DB2|nr:hypothetical protein [Sphingomicrobium aestuariivivum]MCJ8191354.1 hypothetical protein [Sphingomicrobium aestuariivivum]